MHTSFWQYSVRFLASATVWLMLLSCTTNNNREAAPQTIADRILEDDQFTFLRTLVAQANEGDLLKDGNLTLFAPSDSAFLASGFSNPAAVMALSKEAARSLLLSHVLYGSVTADRIPTGQNAVEMAGKGIAFFNKSTDGTVYINSAKLVLPNLQTANGYIHKMDRVLTTSSDGILKTIQQNPNLTFLTAAIQRIGTSNPTLLTTITNTLSTNMVTVFAPNDDAFKASSQYNSLSAIASADAQTLANTLLYHMTNGVTFSNQLKSGTVTSLLSGKSFKITVGTSQTTIKGNANQTEATIKQADLTTANGVVYIIDKLLLP